MNQRCDLVQINRPLPQAVSDSECTPLMAAGVTRRLCETQDIVTLLETRLSQLTNETSPVVSAVAGAQTNPVESAVTKLSKHRVIQLPIRAFPK